MPGEMRELCGIETRVRIDAAVERLAGTCLPRQMPEKGYRTVAIHGYKSRMFQRSDWYPQIGFERSYFLEDLKSMAAMHICEGAFPGSAMQILQERSTVSFRHRYRVNLRYLSTG